MLWHLRDKDDIATRLQSYPHGIDGLDIPRFTSMFEDDIELDLASWSGAPSSRVRPAEWAENLMTRMAALDGTQHMLSHPFITIDGDEATSRPEVIALHFLAAGDERRVHAIGGHYEHRWRRTPSGWKVTAMRLTVRWEMGDRGIFSQAMARANRRDIRRR